MEQFEIKRKVFDLVEQIGERSYKVSRKNKLYFLKDFGNDTKGFEKYTDELSRLNRTGLSTPKLYVYDKGCRMSACEFIEGKTVLDTLKESELDELVYDNAFKANWYAKHEKVAVSWDPLYWVISGEKLYYLGSILGKFKENDSFEKEGIFLWLYSKDFIQYLMNHGIRVDESRKNETVAANKKIALTVVKYYR